MPLSPCAEQVRHADPDRFLTTLFAPAEAREDLFALYAFNDELARARETTREPLVGAMRLQWWREALDDMASGRAPRHPVAEALARAMARRHWDTAALARLIEAREQQDFADAPPADLKTLESVVEATSGTLALLALRTLAVEDPGADRAGHHVGIACGLSGTLRAIPSHARQGRVLLPANIMAEEGLEPRDLGHERGRAALGRVVAGVAELAEAHLVAARRLTKSVPRAALPALLGATLAAMDLAALRRARYDPFDPGVARSGIGRRLAVTWRAFTRRY